MNFIITTTDNIEGGTIRRYIDTVCANVVIGTNVFSDVHVGKVAMETLMY